MPTTAPSSGQVATRLEQDPTFFLDEHGITRSVTLQEDGAPFERTVALFDFDRATVNTLGVVANKLYVGRSFGESTQPSATAAVLTNVPHGSVHVVGTVTAKTLHGEYLTGIAQGQINKLLASTTFHDTAYTCLSTANTLHIDPNTPHVDTNTDHHCQPSPLPGCIAAWPTDASQQGWNLTSVADGRLGLFRGETPSVQFETGGVSFMPPVHNTVSPEHPFCFLSPVALASSSTTPTTTPPYRLPPPNSHVLFQLRPTSTTAQWTLEVDVRFLAVNSTNTHETSAQVLMFVAGATSADAASSADDLRGLHFGITLKRIDSETPPAATLTLGWDGDDGRSDAVLPASAVETLENGGACTLRVEYAAEGFDVTLKFASEGASASNLARIAVPAVSIMDPFSSLAGLTDAQHHWTIFSGSGTHEVEFARPMFFGAANTWGLDLEHEWRVRVNDASRALELGPRGTATPVVIDMLGGIQTPNSVHAGKLTISEFETAVPKVTQATIPDLTIQAVASATNIAFADDSTVVYLQALPAALPDARERTVTFGIKGVPGSGIIYTLDIVMFLPVDDAEAALVQDEISQHRSLVRVRFRLGVNAQTVETFIPGSTTPGVAIAPVSFNDATPIINETSMLIVRVEMTAQALHVHATPPEHDGDEPDVGQLTRVCSAGVPRDCCTNRTGGPEFSGLAFQANLAGNTTGHLVLDNLEVLETPTGSPVPVTGSQWQLHTRGNATVLAPTDSPAALGLVVFNDNGDAAALPAPEVQPCAVAASSAGGLTTTRLRLWDSGTSSTAVFTCTASGEVDCGGAVLANVGTPVNHDDVVTMNYLNVRLLDIENTTPTTLVLDDWLQTDRLRSNDLHVAPEDPTVGNTALTVASDGVASWRVLHSTGDPQPGGMFGSYAHSTAQTCSIGAVSPTDGAQTPVLQFPSSVTPTSGALSLRVNTEMAAGCELHTEDLRISGTVRCGPSAVAFSCVDAGNATTNILLLSDVANAQALPSVDHPHVATSTHFVTRGLRLWDGTSTSANMCTLQCTAANTIDVGGATLANGPGGSEFATKAYVDARDTLAVQTLEDVEEILGDTQGNGAHLRNIASIRTQTIAHQLEAWVGDTKCMLVTKSEHDAHNNFRTIVSEHHLTTKALRLWPGSGTFAESCTLECTSDGTLEVNGATIEHVAGFTPLMQDINMGGARLTHLSHIKATGTSLVVDTTHGENLVRLAGTNVLLGENAGQYADDNAENVILGSSAASSSQFSGEHNVILGHRAAEGATSGNDNNVVVGYQALLGGTQGTSNTVLGSQALSTNSEVADHRIALGDNAGFGVTTADYSVCIGSGASLGNQLVHGSCATNTRHFSPAEDAKVGLGTESQRWKEVHARHAALHAAEGGSRVTSYSASTGDDEFNAALYGTSTNHRGWGILAQTFTSGKAFTDLDFCALQVGNSAPVPIVRFSHTGGLEMLNFTGQHRVVLKGREFDESLVGRVVVSTDAVLNLDGTTEPAINDTMPVVELSSSRAQKSVFGVISGVERHGERKARVGNVVSLYRQQDNVDRVYVNSVGEGAAWVCDANGPLENGDLCCTSRVASYCELQDDDLYHGYTLLKVTQSVDFDLHFDSQPSKHVRFMTLDGTPVSAQVFYDEYDKLRVSIPVEGESIAFTALRDAAKSPVRNNKDESVDQDERVPTDDVMAFGRPLLRDEDDAQRARRNLLAMQHKNRTMFRAVFVGCSYHAA